MKILIVDDDPVSRKLLEKQMSDFAECEAAETGKEAISAYKSGWENWVPFDLITLDISMPDIDGKEVLKTIRTIEYEKNIPKSKQVKILIATANADIASFPFSAASHSAKSDICFSKSFLLTGSSSTIRIFMSAS